MRRIFPALAFIAILFLCCCRISPETHEHDFNCGTVTARVEPTCFIDGFESVRCRYCEVEQVTVIPSRQGHTRDEGHVVWVDGHEVTTYRCALCGEFIETVVEHHLSDEWTSDDLTHWHAYTCGCGMREDEASHFFEESSVIYGTGCERVRIITRTCTICAHVVTDAYPVIDHTPGEPVAEGGLLVTRCTLCGAVLSVE